MALKLPPVALALLKAAGAVVEPKGRASKVQLLATCTAGIGQLTKLTDLRIEYADAVAALPTAPADVRALRLLFHSRFSDDDIRKSAKAQPEKKYLAAFVKTLA